MTPHRLRCDPWAVGAGRRALCLFCGVVQWHFGAQVTPWHPGPEPLRLLVALATFGWGAWHLAAWLASSITVADGALVLRRLSADGLDAEIISLANVEAVLLLPRSGWLAGRGGLRTRRITLRLAGGALLPLGTISASWGLEGKAQEIAVLLGCGVEEPAPED